MELSRSELAARIEQTAKLAFEGTRFTEVVKTSSWRNTTRAIKEVFGDLGKSLGYQVAAAGYAHADEGEWLYDMVWYVVNKGLLVQQAMILESELKPGGSVLNAVAVDGDFQKLVQARAEVRVWLALIPNQEMLQQHIANCKSQARDFAGASPGDTYIFVVYDWTTANTLIERFEIDVPGQPQIST